MSNNFLRQYFIPAHPKSNLDSETQGKYVQQEENQEETNTLSGISNSSLYFPPGRRGNENDVIMVQHSSPLKRHHETEPIVSNSDNKITIFSGRDSSYPDELNILIKPLKCDLCKVQLNSQKTASCHYTSKNHYRKITAWLTEHCPDRPPPVKRLSQESSTVPGPLHCDLCDLPLTSLAHATQHYSGRRHNLVANKKSIPSGAGYYNPEGKWIRTGTKKFSFKNDDNRFGIGEDFIQLDICASPEVDKPKKISTVVSPISCKPVDESLCCKVCNIVVTSATQMAMHVSGSKHKKKLADEALTSEISMDESINGSYSSDLASTNNDETGKHLSMYRIPTGSYYCQVCNATMNHETIFQQHIQGKRHRMKVKVSSQSKEALESTSEDKFSSFYIQS